MRLFNHTDASRFSALALFNFVDYTVINGAAAQKDNINAGGLDVPAVSAVTGTLDDTELKACLDNDPKVAVADVGALTTAGEMLAIATAAVAIEPSAAGQDEAFAALAAACVAKITAAGLAATANAANLHAGVIAALDAKIEGLDLSTAAIRDANRRKGSLEDMERLWKYVNSAAGAAITADS